MIAIPHGLPAAILAELSDRRSLGVVTAAVVACRLGLPMDAREVVDAIDGAVDAMTEAGFLVQTAGWDATWRLPRPGEGVRRG